MSFLASPSAVTVPPPMLEVDDSLGALVGARIERLLGELPQGSVEGLHPVVMREVEAALLESVLRHTGGRRERAALILGLHRNSLRQRLRALGLDTKTLQSGGEVS